MKARTLGAMLVIALLIGTFFVTPVKTSAETAFLESVAAGTCWVKKNSDVSKRQQNCDLRSRDSVQQGHERNRYNRLYHMGSHKWRWIDESW